MRVLKLLSVLCCAFFMLAFQCESEPVSTGDPLYIRINTEDTLYFESIFAEGKPALHNGMYYVYNSSWYEDGGIALPLSPFEDTLTYIFRQANR